MPDPTGQDALAAIDKLLADQPHADAHAFSQASHELSAWREVLIRRWRETGTDADSARLARANAILSVLVGGQFPLGPVPWPHIEKARDSLAALLSAP